MSEKPKKNPMIKEDLERIIEKGHDEGFKHRAKEAVKRNEEGKK